MVLYAVISEDSVNTLFKNGFVPGILMGVILIFKVALLFLTILIDHHQIRHGGKQAFSGKSAFAHRHALKDTGDGRYRGCRSAAPDKSC